MQRRRWRKTSEWGMWCSEFWIVVLRSDLDVI